MRIGPFVDGAEYPSLPIAAMVERTGLPIKTDLLGSAKRTVAKAVAM